MERHCDLRGTARSLVGSPGTLACILIIGFPRLVIMCVSGWRLTRCVLFSLSRLQRDQQANPWAA